MDFLFIVLYTINFTTSHDIIIASCCNTCQLMQKSIRDIILRSLLQLFWCRNWKVPIYQPFVIESAVILLLFSCWLVTNIKPGLFFWCIRSHASAHRQTYLHVLFVAHMKNHIQLKRSCSIRYSSFNPLFLFTSILRAPSLNNAVYVNLSHTWKIIFSWKGLVPLDILLSILRFCLWASSLNNAVYVNSGSQALVTMDRMPPKTVCQFYWAFFVSVFSFIFLEPPKLILYTILNVKFLPFV